MSEGIEEGIDLTNITRNNSPLTPISLTKARREISRQLQTSVWYVDQQTHDHDHSYIVGSKSDWLKKRQVTSQISNQPTQEYTVGTHTY